MIFKNVNQLDNQMKEIQKRLKLFKKKRERFGLTDEEAKDQRKILMEFYLLRDEMVDSRLEEVLFPFLYTVESRNVILEIQKYIPWNGGAIIRNEDVDKITEAIDKLTPEQHEIVCESVEFIHDTAINKIAVFANKASDDDIVWLESVASFVYGREGGNIFDVISYIDERYKDFGDLLELELPEIEIEVEGEEDF